MGFIKVYAKIYQSQRLKRDISCTLMSALQKGKKLSPGLSLTKDSRGNIKNRRIRTAGALRNDFFKDRKSSVPGSVRCYENNPFFQLNISLSYESQIILMHILTFLKIKDVLIFGSDFWQ